MRQRLCWVPTWRGWLLLALVTIIVAWLALKAAYPFLAPTEPLPGGVLVVEGWAGDRTLRFAVSEIRNRHFTRCIVTGGPLEEGAPLSEYKTFAQLGEATLLRIGLATNEVIAVPAPFVIRDRTYTAAVTLGKWLASNRVAETNFTVMTSGAHARRSRLLFERALGPQYHVGVIAMRPGDYEPARWWRSSQGFRVVTSEALAYAYARFIF